MKRHNSHKNHRIRKRYSHRNRHDYNYHKIGKRYQRYKVKVFEDGVLRLCMYDGWKYCKVVTIYSGERLPHD